MSINFEQQFTDRTPNSHKLYKEGQKYLPGGVAGNGKFLQPYPIYITDARGSKIIDVDGNEYIDYIMGAGVHILGHSNEAILSAVAQQLPHGTQLYIPAEIELKLAQKVCELMPSIDMVRFVNSGTEATMMALRAAKAYSKRNRVAKFEGNYHGQHPYALISTLGTNGETDMPLPHIDSAGITPNTKEDVLVLPFNNADRTVSLISQYAYELGAVIIEPVSAFGLGVVPADKEFLQALRDVTTRYEIPLIFDEIVTNFRLGLGGAAEYFGITPDLVCLGKILGGGFPIGGYGGRQELMEKVVTPKTGVWDLKEQIFQSGSFSGNPISMAAGYTTLLELEENDIYPAINASTQKLAEGITKIGQRSGFDILVNVVTSMFQIHFGTREIRNKRDAMKMEKEAASNFHLGLRANGIYASYHPLFISTAHNDTDTQRFLDVTDKVLKEMKG